MTLMPNVSPVTLGTLKSRNARKTSIPLLSFGTSLSGCTLLAKNLLRGCKIVSQLFY